MKNAVDGMWHFEKVDFSENLNFLKKKEIFWKFWVFRKILSLKKIEFFENFDILKILSFWKFRYFYTFCVL